MAPPYSSNRICWDAPIGLSCSLAKQSKPHDVRCSQNNSSQTVNFSLISHVQQLRPNCLLKSNTVMFKLQCLMINAEIQTLNQQKTSQITSECLMRTSRSHSLAIQPWKVTHVCMTCSDFYLYNMVFNLRWISQSAVHWAPETPLGWAPHGPLRCDSPKMVTPGGAAVNGGVFGFPPYW